MEDSVEVILLHKSCKLSHHTQEKFLFSAASGSLLMGVYGLWTYFALPGFRKVPICLKVLDVIYHIMAAMHNKELPILLYDIFLDGNNLHFTMLPGYSDCLGSSLM